MQVTEETSQILQHFGYEFEQRGLVAVKGKGQLMTYYLLGKAGKTTPPTAQISPIAGVSTIMETVTEEDESHDSPTSKSEEKTVIECSADAKSDDEGEVFITTEVDVVVGQEENCSDARDSTENTLLLGQYGS